MVERQATQWTHSTLSMVGRLELMARPVTIGTRKLELKARTVMIVLTASSTYTETSSVLLLLSSDS